MSSPETLLPLFRIRFPEFIAVEDPTVLMYLGDALSIFNCNDTATQYLAAHFLVLDIDSGAGSTGGDVDGGSDNVVSESVGAISTTWKTSNTEKASDIEYETTPYGRRYMQFRNATPAYRVSMRVH